MKKLLFQVLASGFASIILTCIAAVFFFWADWKIGVGFILCCLAGGLDREGMASYKELLRAFTDLNDKGGPT